jgi:hypothetical protein
MNLANKTFKNIKTGEVIKVIDSFEDIAILENKKKMSVTELINSNLFTEEIDPNNFFNNQSSYNILADKIKNIPTDMIKDEDGVTPISTNIYDDNFKPLTNESAIIYSSEEDEKEELIRKYSLKEGSTQQVNRQNEVFQKILEEDRQPDLKSEPVKFESPVQMQAEDPIISMFKRAKKIVEFNVSINIENKIPRLDFIEMMEDSYDISMIDFLAEEFTKEILQNPEFIQQQIKNKITEMVYGESKVDSQITDSVTTSTENVVNSQITDSVTGINTNTEKKPTPKPRTTRAKKKPVSND